jgi:hypothetical protein
VRSPGILPSRLPQLSRNLGSTPHLLLAASTLEQAAGLGVEELVAIDRRYQHTIPVTSLSALLGRTPRQGRSILPLNSPVHGSVGDNEGRNNVENLVAEPTEAVEDGSVEGTSKGTLAVGGERIGGNALGGRAA